MNTLTKKIAAGAAAFALVLGVAGTVSADPVWATVTGHAASTSDNNKAEFWGEDCFKLDGGEGDLGVEDGTYELGASYDLVIVKAGSAASAGDNALTLFADASAGETVWADTNGNNVFDEGDKNISHIIFCGEQETTTSFTSSEESTTSVQTTTEETTTEETTTEETTSSVETTTSFESSVESTTDSQSSSTSFTDSVSDTTSQPPTDTLGATGTGQQSGSLWFLLAMLGALAGSVIVLAPSKAKQD